MCPEVRDTAKETAPAATAGRHSRLEEFLGALLADDQRLIVASNRGPLTFRHEQDQRLAR